MESRPGRRWYPFYPWFPLLTIVIATFSILTMIYFNVDFTSAALFWRSISVWYLAFLLAAFVYYYGVVRQRLTAEDIAHFRRLD